MNELALFAGVGGGLLGSHLLGFTPICAVEIEPYCREVLLRRQRDGVLPMFPIWDDIRTFDGTQWRGVVDIVTAGFPCQPFSVAGKQRREGDERNMWPDTIRVIREVRPRFALLENVPGLVRCDYFGQILADLAAAGFDAEWDVISAGELGAPHRRERLWIVCHANGQGQPVKPIDAEESGVSGDLSDPYGIAGRVQPKSGGELQAEADTGDHCAIGDVADAHMPGREEPGQPIPVRTEQPGPTVGGWWETEPEV